MSDEPSIELPDGSPGAVGDAGAGLDRVAGGFERGGAVVARATAAVAGWEGRASVSFHGTAASYSEALGAVNEALIGARVAVRRYETRLEDARVKIRALMQDEQDALERLRTVRRQLTQARGRLQDAQQRAATASLAIGSMTGGADPIGLAEQAAAQRDAREAQDDIDRALKKIEREQQEIRESRQKAAREHRDLTQDEHDAATQVRAAADHLPDVTLSGGGASPRPMPARRLVVSVLRLAPVAAGTRRSTGPDATRSASTPPRTLAAGRRLTRSTTRYATDGSRRDRPTSLR